jgi:hypothetical protein
MTNEEIKKWDDLVKKSTIDDALRSRLLNNTMAVLKEHGLQPPLGLQVKVLENSMDVMYMVLPAQESGELSENAMERVAGGASTGATRSGNDPAPWFRS